MPVKQTYATSSLSKKKFLGGADYSPQGMAGVSISLPNENVF
jgi:hypothetical protein